MVVVQASAHSVNWPTATPATPSNVPLRRRCISIRSTLYGGSATSSS